MADELLREMDTPYIDPNVEHVGVSRLRKLNATNLRKSRKTLVIQDNDTPLAVLLAYEQFLRMQTKMRQLIETIELLSNSDEREMLRLGLADVEAGRTKSFAKIRRVLVDEDLG
jgi:PHD/YefM family antitoxin component YafN of YafNO toxin-antitoxin module